MLLCHMLGMSIQRRWQFRADNAAIFEFDVGEDYSIVMRANDATHLRGMAAIPDHSDDSMGSVQQSRTL